jgi:hypothetical protein
MSISHAVAGLGKWGASRVDIFLDGTRVACADFNPLENRFFLQNLILPTQGEIITIAQKKNASEKELDRMLAERDATESKLKAAQASENSAAISVYVRSLPASLGFVGQQSETPVTASAPVFVPSPEPPEPPVFAAVPRPDSILELEPEPAIDRNRLILLENRADRIDSVLNRYDARIKAIEDAIAAFDFEEARKQLKSLDSKMTNVEAEQRVTAAHLKTHLKRCWYDNHGGGGFNKLDIPDELEALNAPRKL